PSIADALPLIGSSSPQVSRVRQRCSGGIQLGYKDVGTTANIRLGRLQRRKIRGGRGTAHVNACVGSYGHGKCLIDAFTTKIGRENQRVSRWAEPGDEGIGVKGRER